MVEWHGEKFLDLTAKQLGDNLEAAAIFFKEKVKDAVNRSQPYSRSKGAKGIWYKGLDPSGENEPPKKVRGDLQRSINHKMSADRQEAFVGTGVDYGLYLEVGTSKMAPRPYLRTTLIANKETIAKIVATGKR